MKASIFSIVATAFKSTRSLTLSVAVMVLGLVVGVSAGGNAGPVKAEDQSFLKSNLFRNQTVTAYFDLFDLPDGPIILGPGGYFIPMDRYPNGQKDILRAYGLVYELLRHGVPVRQLINPTKPADGHDFVNALNADMVDLRTGAIVPSRPYRGGAFLVDATAATSYKALPIIQAWQASASDHTTVHRMVGGGLSVNIARSIYAAPRIAVLKDGNELIAFSNLNAAGITDSRGAVWTATSPDLLTEAQVAGASSVNHNDGILSSQPGGSPRYSYLVAMHYSTSTTNTPEVVAEIRSWLASSPLTHAFMQCDSARLVENTGFFLTTGGIVDDGNPPAATPANIAPANPLSQIDGPFQADTGAVESIGLAVGSTFKTGVTTLFNNSGSPLTQRILMMTGRMDGSSSNGNVTYLAGHDYSTDLLDPQSNGVRLMLNTILGTGATDDFTNGPPSVSLSSPTYSNTRQIPYELTYRNFNTTIASPGDPIRLIATIPIGTAYVPGSASVPPTSVSSSEVIWDTVSPAFATFETITYSVSALTDGSYVGRVRQTGSPSGVVLSISSLETTTIVDTIPPSVSISPTNPFTFSISSPSFIFDVASGGSLATIRCRFDAGPYVPCMPPSYTSPVALLDGNHQFWVVATDAAGNTSDAVFGFTVDTVNDAPVITTIAPVNATEDTQYNYLPAFTDPDGPGATWSLAGGNTCGGTINPASGAFTVTPSGPAPPGACSVSITVCDGGSPNACSTQTTTVSITAVNDAPTSVAPSTVTAIEDTPANIIGLSVADGDSPIINITLSVTNGTLSLGNVSGIAFFNNSGGTIGFAATPASANAALATLSFTPGPNFNGTVPMTFTTSDSVAADVVKTISVVVVAVNDAPVLNTPGFLAIPDVSYSPGPPVGVVGILVSSLVDLTVPSGGLDNVTDPDAGALTGIAVTECGTIKGTCFYSINNGTTWIEVGDVTTSSRLLAADTNTRIFFKPNALVFGTVPAAFTFRAWDRTSGTNGGTANTTINGGSTAFSTATANAVTVISGPSLLSIAVTPDNLTIAPGATLQLTATGTFSNGSTQNLTNFATWGAANAQNVGVSNAPGSKGLALASQTTVCCTPVSAMVDGISGTARFAVGTPPSITSANAKTFAAGMAGSFTVTTTGTYAAAISKTGSLPAGMTFVDNGNGTATISGTPTATGVFPLTLTANANMPPNAVQPFTLTVTAPPLVSLIITPSNSTLNVGGTRQFTATGSYADGSAQNLTDVVTWTSSVIAVARISNTSGSRGVATGLSAGTTQIGIQYNGATSSTQLTVTNPILPTTTTITCPSSVAYAGAVRTPCTATVTGTGLNQSVAVTYTNNLNAGTATANASYAGSGGFAASTAAPKTFTITKINPTCTVTGYSLNFDGLPHTATGSCKGILNETLSGLTLTGTTHTNSGSYSDTWTIAASTNYNAKTGTVTDVIGTLRAAKQAIRTELNSAVSSAISSRDRDKLRDAIDKLDDALDSDLWRSDGNHLDCEDGSEVFVETKSAVKKLMDMIADRSSSNISDTTIQRWINILVQIDRRLAQIAIQEASVSNQTRSNAQYQFDEGDDDITDGDFDKALTHYKRAWKTVRSCNGHNDDDDDDHCGHHDH